MNKAIPEPGSLINAIAEHAVTQNIHHIGNFFICQFVLWQKYFLDYSDFFENESQFYIFTVHKNGQDTFKVSFMIGGMPSDGLYFYIQHFTTLQYYPPVSEASRGFY